MPIIHCSGLTKTYRVRRREPGFRNAVKTLFSPAYDSIQALRGVGFSIEEGEIAGYIGPNGAGKSTTIKILCGILTPDAGTCDIRGKVPWRDRTAHVRDIGVVFGQRSQLWWDVPVGDSFALLRDIYRVPQAEYRRSLDELTALLDLEALLRTPARQLSLGQRMRCEVAASLLHNPRLLFLDEPTIGLDAPSKLAVRDFIKRRNAENGTTVLLTTHDMLDVEALCTRILFIGKGELLVDGTLEALTAHFPGETLIAEEMVARLYAHYEV
jgi:ABC-2 type transport system ATP-binding protein